MTKIPDRYRNDFVQKMPCVIVPCAGEKAYLQRVLEKKQNTKGDDVDDKQSYNHKNISLTSSVGLPERNSKTDTHFDLYDPFL